MWMLVNVLPIYAHVTWSKHSKGQSLCVKKPQALFVWYFFDNVSKEKCKLLVVFFFFPSQKI